MSVSFRPDPISAHDGGLDVVLSYTLPEAAALGPFDPATLADWFDTALLALVWLRTGQASGGEPLTASHWGSVISALDHRLLPRLNAVRDAAIRAHAEAGGSVGQLALAMDGPRSTAQYRRENLLSKPPTPFELWATNPVGKPKPQ